MNKVKSDEVSNMLMVPYHDKIRDGFWYHSAPSWLGLTQFHSVVF
jgi:hypothetical protein